MRIKPEEIKNKAIGLIVSLGLILSSHEIAAQVEKAENLDDAVKSVALIYAKRDGKTVKGTGFHCTPGRIVTALHVVANAEQIEVKFPGKWKKNATVIKTLPGHDLALLSAEDLDGIKTLLMVELRSNEEIFFALGARANRDFTEDIRVRIPRHGRKKELRELLDGKSLDSLRGNGILHLSTEVFNVHGELKSGISGAPIVDREGQVVAICSGGINEGVDERCFAIPAIRVKKLYQEGEGNYTFQKLEDLQALMAYTNANDNRKGKGAFEVNGFTFHHKKTLSFENLIDHADDSLGALNIAQQSLNGWVRSHRGNENIMKQKFDVWEERNSGAAIVLPTNIKIKERGNYVEYESRELSFRIFFSEFHPGYPEALNDSLQSYSQVCITSDSECYWQPDQVVQYWNWRRCAGGVDVYRGGMLGLLQRYDQWDRPLVHQYNRQPVVDQLKYAFQTYAHRDGKTLYVVAKRERETTRPEWYLLVAGAHMSGFMDIPDTQIGQ